MGVIISAFAGWLLRALGMAVGTTFIAVIGTMFSDQILGLIASVVDLFGNAVGQTGINLPTVGDAVSALPVQMLQVMKRIRLDDGLSIIVTAAAFRGLTAAFDALRTMRRGVPAP